MTEQTKEKIIVKLPENILELDKAEIQKEIAKVVSEKTINEILVIRDDALGRHVELQSGTRNINELNDLGWLVWQNFFLANRRTPSYIN